MHPAMWQKQLSNGAVQCELCPFKCIIDEGDRGICGVRAVVNDTLRALTYSRPASINLDPIEKKPLFHFTPTAKALSIATVGCNLSCSFCQNWSLSQALPENTKTKVVTPKEVVSIAIQSEATTIAYTYSEPTVFYEYMFDTAKLAHENGIANLLVTCGFIEKEPLLELCSYLDAANVDLKSWSDEFYRDYLKAMKAPVLRTLKILVEQGVWVEITNLIIPDANDNPENIRQMCRWIADSLGTGIPLHFSRFHPNYKLTDRPSTPGATLEMAYEIAKQEGIKFVYVGNIRGTEHEDTYCPNCNAKLIDRTGYFIESNYIDNGKCAFCGTKIEGVW
ncbi:AmmeMemoRadiSam system radical SAM enzyme [bacterium]|nr:AmmeMemoRadiSam system radical SAM enzyme [bacterium]